MKSKSTGIVPTVLLLTLTLLSAAHAGEILNDAFDDNTINATQWTTWGTAVIESDQILKVLQNQTDAGGNIQSIPLPISPVGTILISRNVRLHYSNSYFIGSTFLDFGDLPRVSIRYGHMSYNGAPHQSVYGFYITRNNTNPHSRESDPSDISSMISPVWDTWFTETILYNPQTGDLQYLIDGDLKTTFNVGAMPSTASPTLTVRFDSWGWWTGHQHYIDNLLITQDQTQIASLPLYHHNPQDGRQAVKDFHLTPEGTCRFTFSTDDVGSMCIVAWTRNLKNWFPLVQFNTEEEGTEIEDLPRDPKKFYRATYLPSGVSVADRFDYPLGDKGNNPDGTPKSEGVPEFPDGSFDENNDLYNAANSYQYPESQGNNPDRGQLSGNTSEWRNVQDVGSYLPGLGIHVGEDWNLGSGEYDVGEKIYATANGQVISIRPANQSNLGKWGWMMIIRHWLPNGDSHDSVYVHIAPDQFNGEDNSGAGKGLIGTLADKQDFSYQEGAIVARGDPIAVVANLEPSYLPPPNEEIRENWPHLHFEMRDSQVDGSDPWIYDNGTGYYGSVATPGIVTPSEVQAAFDKMRLDGVIDPSDFIDAHRN